MTARRAATVVCCCAVAAAVAEVIAQGSRPPAGLEPSLLSGTRLTRHIRPPETDRFRLELQAGDFFDITIRQQGVDLRAAVLRPDGSTLLTVDTRPPVSGFGAQSVAAIADAAGTYALVIAPVSASALGVQYTIEVEDIRPAAAPDERRVEAERIYERARALDRTNDAAVVQQAVGLLHEALARFRQLQHRRSELKVLLELAGAQRLLGRPEGLETVQQAVALAQALSDAPSLATATYYVARMMEYLGDLPAARREYEQAAEMHHALGDRRGETAALNGEGTIYGRTGDGERALTLFERALALARASGDDDQRLMIENNLGITYKNVGEYERSLAMYEDTLVVARRRNDVVMQTYLLTNMGNLQERLARYDLAMEYQRQALAVARAAGRPENEARALNAIGRLELRRGANAEALQSHRQALEIRRRMADLDGQAASLSSEGRALHALGEDAAAVRSLEEALALRRRLNDLMGEGDTLQALATVARDRGDAAKAAEYIRTAIERDETVRARLTSPQLRTSFVAAEHDKYEFYIDVLQRQAAQDAAGGYEAAALEVSERARARVLLESMLAGSVDLRQGVDSMLLERERSMQKALSEASARLARALRSSDAGANKSAAEHLERLTADYQRLEAEIRQHSPRYAAVTQPAPLPVPEIQRTVLDEDTVLLEFALGSERSWLWAVTRTGLWSTPLPARPAIEEAARAVYDDLVARQARPNETAAGYAARVAVADRRLQTDASALSAMLLGGLAPRLEEWKGKRLAIVSSGALDYLPFAALPLPGAANGELLASAFEIVNLPSASVLHAIREDAKSRRSDRRGIAIVADPVFDAADARVRGAGSTSGVRVRPAAASIAPGAGDGLGRLLFTRREADAIAALAPAVDTLRILDFDANRDRILGGALDGYRIVHLATHGILNDARPSLSALVLSLVDPHGKPRDGYVRLHDIYNMRVDADLVVLSACQTALGKQIRGEGLVGLARAFMYAGAPRVVATLWEVNDVATAQLMTRFYATMLQDHLAPAAALHAAQRSMSTDPRWRSPYYWAGFVLQGEWR